MSAAPASSNPANNAKWVDLTNSGLEEAERLFQELLEERSDAAPRSASVSPQFVAKIGDSHGQPFPKRAVVKGRFGSGAAVIASALIVGCRNCDQN